jgi:hypothetical protein
MLIDKIMYYYELGKFPLAVTIIASFITRLLEIFVCFIELSLRISGFNDSTNKKYNLFKRFFERNT